MSTGEFREIGHTGGTFSVELETQSDGTKLVSVGYQHSRPTPASMFLLLALPQGIPFCVVAVGGIGAPTELPESVKQVETVQVMIASDSHGYFGHSCPRCDGYWRSDSTPARWAMTCPYCAFRSSAHMFLTAGQKAFVRRFCNHYYDVINEKPDGKHVIDMDAIADEVARGATPPSFFHVEQSQQQRWRCETCDSANDILGKFGYCGCCGTRNNKLLLMAELEKLKTEVDAKPASVLRDAVSALDSCGRDYVKALLQVVSLSDRRERRARDNLKFHDLPKMSVDLLEIFDIAIAKGMQDDDIERGRVMFLRRHVHEHNGGVADATYLQRSNDKSVREGQAIREKPDDVRWFIQLLERMAANLHAGVLELIPPDETAVKICQPRKKRSA